MPFTTRITQRTTLLGFAAVMLTACAVAAKEPVEPAPPPAASVSSEINTNNRVDASELAAHLVGPVASAAEPELGADVTTPEPTLDPEGYLEDGFCADDIYAKYLIQRFEKERPTREQASRERPEALFFAQKRLSGSTASYFGAIPVVTNERVERWIQYFKTAGRQEFMRWLVRGESVKKVVQPLLKDAGLPIEFFYLAMVESGFKNSAHSRKAATGTWQFMRGTAKRYGLKMDHWVDERRDPAKSSIAAANLLKALYKEFGDWNLAMAAYNAGPGKVKRAMRAAGTRDFWKIAKTTLLPRETKSYVPKVLAAILLASDARNHGFDFQANEADMMPETEVLVQRPVRLDELANELGVPHKTIALWNPELIRNVTPPTRGGGYRLRLASKYANMFQAVERRLSLIEITEVQMHTIKHGDTLSRIARQYKVDVQQLKTLNPDLDAKTLRPGRQVAVPVPGVVTVSKAKPA